jgi:ferredoxin
MTDIEKKISTVVINNLKCIGCCGCEFRCPEVFIVGDCLENPDACKSQLLPNAFCFFVSHRTKIEFASSKCVEQAIRIEYEDADETVKT